MGFTAADVDTSLDSFLSSPGGIDDQCERLNDIVRSVCCDRFEIGCHVSYSCQALETDDRDRMTQTPYYYVRENDGATGYALHHGSVQEDVIRFFRNLQLYGRLHRRIPVAYSLHPLRIDDEETKHAARKIDRLDPAFLLLGSFVPGLSERGGTRMRLDYYASRDGMLLSVAPANRSSLAQAIAEFRANLFSFHGKQFSGRGARDLFDLAAGGPVPKISGCQALAIREPAHLQSLLPVDR